MDHRKIDVNDSIDQIREALEELIGPDPASALQRFEGYFEELRDNLDDIDCAILDVLLARNVPEARSIAMRFQAHCAEE